MTTIIIKRWERKYRLKQAHVYTWEQIAHRSVLPTFQEETTAFLANPREVIVFRRISLKLKARIDPTAILTLGEQWGSAMAIAVRETLQQNDPRNVKRFPDREEQVVRYLEAVLDGSPIANAWYFDAVRCHDANKQSNPSHDLEHILERYIRSWPVLFERLTQRGLALTLFNRLCPLTQQQLWLQGMQDRNPPPEHECGRLHFSMALKILNLLTHLSLTPSDTWSALKAFLFHQEAPSDWSSARQHATAVFAAICFLCERFSLVINRNQEQSSSIQAGMTGQDPSNHCSSTLTRWEEFIATIDWLDRDFLLQQITCLNDLMQLSPTPREAVATCIDLNVMPTMAQWQGTLPNPLPHNPRENNPLERASSISSQKPSSPSKTPCNYQLESAWLHTWKQITPQLLGKWDATSPTSAANCLLATTLLTEQHLEWIHDPDLPNFVEHALANLAVHNLTSAEELAAFTLNSSTSDHTIQTTTQNNCDSPFGRILSTNVEHAEYASAAAGIFLLARVLFDLRLVSLGRQAGFIANVATEAENFLVALAARWIPGETARRFDSQLIDPALIAFAQLAPKRESSSTDSPQAKYQQSSAFRLQATLIRQLMDLHLWHRSNPLYVVTQETSDGQRWLLGGDAELQLYPFCAPIDTSTQVDSLLEQWRALLTDLCRNKIELRELHLTANSAELAHLQSEQRFIHYPLWRLPPMEHSHREATLNAVASVVLRYWARSLRGFQHASGSYLLHNFIQRPGRIRTTTQGWEIGLHAKPLDAALSVSGLLDAFEYFDGKKLQRIRFQMLPATP